MLELEGNRFLLRSVPVLRCFGASRNVMSAEMCNFDFNLLNQF